MKQNVQGTKRKYLPKKWKLCHDLQSHVFSNLYTFNFSWYIIGEFFEYIQLFFISKSGPCLSSYYKEKQVMWHWNEFSIENLLNLILFSAFQMYL